MMLIESFARLRFFEAENVSPMLDSLLQNNSKKSNQQN